MTTSNPKMIVTGFYDGPIEGFLRKENANAVYFFKVVAWDDNQNVRLYLLSQVKSEIFDQLVSMILASKSQPCSGEIWVPVWKFDDKDIEKRVNSIIEEGRFSLFSSDILSLGENLLDHFDLINPVGAQLEYAKSFASANWPGRLKDWLSLA